MKKGLLLFTLVFLFFQIVSEEYHPEMTPEVVSDIEIMFEEALFQSYQSGVPFKFPHPVGFTCTPVLRNIDTDLDGLDEQYNLYSLSDCGGTNHVSTVKLQIGGNCTRWSTDAALETALSIMLDGNRPPSSNRTDWTPVHLSNSWTTVMTEQSPNPGFIKNMNDNGTIHAYYFPFHTMPGMWDIGTDWEPHWNKIVGYPYRSHSCNYTTAGIDYETNVKNCLKDEAILNEATFIFPDDTDVMNVTFDGCVDLSAGKSPVACPAVYGGIFDAIQPDYYNMEQKVKDAVFRGKPVLLRARTSVREPSDAVNSNNPLGLYDYIRYYPGWNLGDYLRNGIPAPPAVLRPDDEGVNGEYFNFDITHAITIVGYLENRCWDSNNNNLCDLPDEDINGDGRCTPRDCGTVDFTYLCGDNNHNGVCDGAEVCDPALSCVTDTDAVLHGTVFEMQTQFDYFVIKDSVDQWWLNPGIPIFKIVAVPSSYNSVQDPGSTQRMIHGRTTGWTTGNYLSDAAAITYLFNRIEFGKMIGLNADGNPMFDRNDLYRFSDNDNDGIIDLMDNCPEHPNPDQLDTDGDGVGDACDNCPNISNSDQLNSDSDLMGNACDNCPEDYNKNQLDSDGDGVGDVCDACPYLDNSGNLNIAKYRPEIDANGKLIDPDGIDSDLDGVPDVCDNCPNTSNPRIGVNPYQEIFLSPCDAGTNCEGGAYSMSFTINGGKIYTNGSKVLVPQINWSDYSSVYHYENVYSVFYAWQPDNDLDGIGDACDYSGGNGIDNTDMKGTSTARILNVIPISKDMTEEGGLIRYRENSLYKLTFLAAEWTEANSGVVEKLEDTVHFCGMPQEQYIDPQDGSIRWGLTGYCTTSKATVEGDFWFYKFMPNSDPVLFMGTEVEVPFGYSHGTDPAVGDQDSFPWTHIARTGSAGSAEGIAVENVDEYRKPVTYRPSQKGARCMQTPENSGTACLVDTYWNWRMDALDYMRCELLGNPYSLCNQLIADAVTDPGETEVFHHTLSAGAKGIEDNYLDEINGVQSINPEYFHNKRKYARSARKTFWDMEAGILITGLKVRPIDWTPIHVGSLQPFPGIRKINHWQVDGSKFRLIGKILPENSLAVTTGVFNTLYSVVYVDGNRILRVNHEENPSDWHDVTVIPGWPAELDVSSLDIAGSSLYVTGRDEELPGSPFRIYRFDMNPAKMTFEVIAELSVPLLEPGIMEIGGKALIKGINIVTQKLEFYEAGYNGAEKVGEIPVRYGCTVIAKDGLVYVTGGIDGDQQPENNVLVSNDLGRNFSPFADFEGENIDLTMSFVHFSGGKMYVVNPKENTDGIYRKVAEVDLSDGSFNISLKQIEGITVEQSVDLNYCLNETGNLIKGGLEELGTCMPFTYPWYRSFATGSTIYSVAGKGERLYVGTNNSIKVYDISDPEAFVLKSTFSTGGRIVYDLEVADDDVMYAATSGGIYKLDTANPDTLASLSFFATSYNYQYRIQLYNDKLYVGDDNGINIRDKETFTRLAYVNIDSVLDFAIANGEIALYRSSFWSAGLHIRDVETLNLKAYEYAECYTGELTADHGAFYLSCDGYEYRFEGRPDTYFNYYPLDGDIREMQENHVYNGWTYIPDGSNVKLSTLNDVPSYCGNGVVEPGELCDGNSVACTTISSSYVSGTAACNSTCDGYNESYCEEDGW